MRVSCSGSILTASLLLVGISSGVTAATRGDDSGRLSKNGLTTGIIDGIEVELSYGRPNVRGRDIWGQLVPYGEVWRTGADEATTISFGEDVLVQGERLSAGTYGLFTLPSPTDWVIIFNNVPDQWGAFNYDSAQDALRVTVEPRANQHVEEMGFVIEESQIVLQWERLAIPIAIDRAN